MFEYINSSILAGKNKKITEHISFSIEQNHILALIGESGSGKTMTALSIMGVLPENVCHEGEILLDGKSIKGNKSILGKEIVYIPQNGHEALNPSLTIYQQMKDSLKKNHYKINLKEHAVFFLSKAGLEEAERILDMYPFELSGGMAQRVCIALALLSKAKLVICDEATNGLDEKKAQEFLSLIRQEFQNASIILITHDMNMASLADSIFVFQKGHMVEYGTKDEIFHSQNPYIRLLFASLPENGMEVAYDKN